MPSYTHWSAVGNLFDLFAIAFTVIVAVALFTPHTSVDAYGNVTTYYSAPIGLTVVLIIFGAVTSAMALYRQSRFRFELNDSTLTVQPFRVLGLIPFAKDKRQFNKNELGVMILDLQLRYCSMNLANCCFHWTCGWNGIYFTKGLPRAGGKVEIAFEMPFYHLTQFSFLYHGCHTNAFTKSFIALANMLEFVPCVLSANNKSISYDQTKVIRGDYATHMNAMVSNMNEEMQAHGAAARTHFVNYVAMNPVCCAGAVPHDHGIVHGRMVYYFHDAPAQAASPVAQAAPAGVPVAVPVQQGAVPYPGVAYPAAVPPTPAYAPEQAEFIRARNAATLNQLFALLSTNDCNQIIPSIPAVYRGDFTGTRMLDGQPPAYERYDELPGLFRYVINDLQGRYYGMEMLPSEPGDNPYIIRGVFRVRYPQSNWETFFTDQFDERGLITHGDFMIHQMVGGPA